MRDQPSGVAGVRLPARRRSALWVLGLSAALAASAVGSAPGRVLADSEEYVVQLSGTEVVPGPGSSGTASGGLSIGGWGGQCGLEEDYITWQLGVSGLDTVARLSIHRGAFGQSGPEVVNLPLTTDPVGELSGSATGLASPATFQAIEGNLGGYYLEIDTSSYPGGAVRGQLDGLVGAPPAPSISSVSPATGGVGTTVTITGDGLWAATSVSFGGTQATFDRGGQGIYAGGNSTIYASVPAGATTGAITVVGPGGSASSPSSFSVARKASAPAVTSLSQTSGTAWQDFVTITGSNLAGASSVTFGGVTMTSCWVARGPGQLLMGVPLASSTGKITVSNAGGSGTSKQTFTVLHQGNGVNLAVPFITQYSGQPTQNSDCGPASVAMVMQYLGLRPWVMTDGQFITYVRSLTGNTSGGDTNFPQLEQAIRAFGPAAIEVPATLSPAPTAQVEDINFALGGGAAVIALVHGETLGRFTNPPYGDHWVVVRGFSSDGSTVYLNDSDYRTGKLPKKWINGGADIAISVSTFAAALQAAQVNQGGGPYAIIVQL